MSGIRIASRYAKSLLDLATEQGKLDEVRADMQLMSQVMHDSRDLRIMLSSPVVKADKKIQVLDLIFKGKVSEITLGFSTLLAGKGREMFLPEIVESFLNQLKVQQNFTTAEVISAVPLDNSTRAKVQAAAQQLTTNKVDLNEKVDPSLIGGFILRVGDKQIDASLLNKIKELKRDFSENPYVPEL